MPDFGLTEALAAALKASKGVEVMRPAEVKLAAQAAKAGPQAPVVPTTQRSAAPVAPTTPAVPAAATASPTGVPASVDVPPPVQAAAGAPEATPAPPAVVAPTATSAPPAAGPAPSEPPIAPGPATARPQVAPSATLPAPQPAPLPTPSGAEAVQVQARGFVTANLNDFPPEKLNMTHMPNVDTMRSPDGVKAAILKVADDNKGAIEEARRGTITDEQMVGLAQDIAVNQDVVKQVLEREFGAPLRPEVSLAARMVEQHQIGTLLGLSGKVADGTATSAEIVAFEQQRQLVNSYVSEMGGVRAEAGRGTRVFGIPVGLPGQVVDHIADVLKRSNLNQQEMAQAIRYANTPAGIANIVSGMQNVGLLKGSYQYIKGLVQRVFVNGILSGPGTWAKIIVGNNQNLLLNSFDLFAAGMGRGAVGLASRLGGYVPASEGVQLSDAFAHVHGVISGGADALRVAGRVMRTGVSLDNVMRANEVKITGSRSLAETFPGIQNTYFGGVARIVDGLIDAPGSRIIGSIDEFTKTLGYRGYTTMMSLKDIRARITNGSLKPGDAEAAMVKMMNDPSPEMQQAAEAWAHRMTFQTPFGETGEAFQALINKIPALRFVFPFMRTATNIFKQSLGERTLLGLFSSRIRNQIAAGGFEGDLAKARMATGTAIGGMLAWMAIHDRITGGAPKDAKERAEWELDGRKPYSFNVNGTWYSYMWHEPLASVVGTVADIVKVASYIHSNDDVDSMMPHDQMWQDAAGHVMASIIENTGNKTFMQGAAQFSEMYNDPQRYLMTYARQMGANLVPFSGALKFARNEQDPYMRQATTLVETIQNELPTILGVKGSKTLSARLDMFGELRKTAGGNAILGPLSPFQSSPSKADAVSDEIQDLMEKTRRAPISMPTTRLAVLGTGQGLQGGMGMRLNPDEYNDYVRMSRGDKIFGAGQRTFHEELERTMALPVYQHATAATRVTMLESIAHTADQIGANRLYKENLDFRDRMNAWNAQKNALKFNK